MSNRLENKVAIITGGASGIGAAAVKLFAQEGAKVVIGDLNVEAGEALATEFPESVTFVKQDVSSVEDWENIRDVAIEKYGTIDILLNNAGISVAKSFFTMTVEEYRRIVEINQVSVFLGIQIVGAVLKEKGSGSIVNTSSLNGLVAGAVGYTDTKFAVRGMTKSAAIDLAQYNILVNSVHPGAILTPMLKAQLAEGDQEAFYAGVPLSRGGESVEYAKTIAFLASDESSYATGAEFVLDGGMTALL